ncbi:dnaJ homolog subfamily C member 4 isoform X2 [Ascaphus truei]|uniref:dnaJ homolog subfamily C member 4 isoform X2 n=1 Tax=Ascaphus truei TaxID=8439 RepID=UPI003F59577D
MRVASKVTAEDGLTCPHNAVWESLQGRGAALHDRGSTHSGDQRTFHPDSDLSNPLLHSQFVRLSEAYRVLSRERSRRDYDRLLEALQREGRAPGSHSSYYKEREPSPRPSEDASRYWSQFAQQREEPADRRQRRNGRLVWYCVLIMSGSMIMHYMGFRTLREINNTFIDEQQQRILKLYNEVKERARVNGVRKQQEILRQKHAEYTEKYGGRGRADGAER